MAYSCFSRCDMFDNKFLLVIICQRRTKKTRTRKSVKRKVSSLNMTERHINWDGSECLLCLFGKCVTFFSFYFSVYCFSPCLIFHHLLFDNDNRKLDIVQVKYKPICFFEFNQTWTLSKCIRNCSFLFATLFAKISVHHSRSGFLDVLHDCMAGKTWESWKIWAPQETKDLTFKLSSFEDRKI